VLRAAIRELPGGDRDLLLTAVAETALGEGEHLIGRLPCCENDVGEAHGLLVGSVDLGQLGEHRCLSARRTGLFPVCRIVPSLPDPRVSGERLQPVVLTEHVEDHLGGDEQRAHLEVGTSRRHLGHPLLRGAGGVEKAAGLALEEGVDVNET
jgi:hypothetical protein